MSERDAVIDQIMIDEQRASEDRLQIALANAYAAYMRGLFRPSIEPEETK